MVRRLIFLILLLIITDTTALFHFHKDHKYQYDREEVNHHNYHHQYRHNDHKHHEHKYPSHTSQDQKHHEHKEHVHKESKHKHHDHKRPEYKYSEQKLPQQTNVHEQYENLYYYNHGHSDNQNYKQQEEHKHHNHKQHDHKYREHTYQERNYKNQDQLHAQPHYEFKYGVRDPSTGDFKNQWEVRKGDNVLGEYSFIEADGTIRTVQYTAGKHTGFNAVVKKEGKAKHPVRAEILKYKEVFSEPPPKASLKLSDPILKPVFPVSSYGKAGHRPRNGLHFEVDSPGGHYLIQPDLPVNHKPVFSGIDDDSNILAFYERHPVHSKRPYEEKYLDYGVNEYLSMRNYDLNKISESLNVNSQHAFNRNKGGNLRVVRGSFAMGR